MKEAIVLPEINVTDKLMNFKEGAKTTSQRVTNSIKTPSQILPLKEHLVKQMSEANHSRSASDHTYESKEMESKVPSQISLRQALEESLPKKVTQIKLRAKNLMRQVEKQQMGQNDPKNTSDIHSGYVSESVFFEILDLLHIKIADFDADLIKKRFSHPCEQRIDYKGALAALTVNFNVKKPLEEFWIFRDTNKGTADTMTTVSMKDFLESKIDRESQFLNKSVTSTFIISQAQKPKPRSLTIDPFNALNSKMESIKEENEHIESNVNIISHPDSLLPIPKRTPINSLFSFKSGQHTQTVNQKIKWLSTNEPERFQNITNMLRAINDSKVDIRKLEYFRHRIFKAPDSKTPAISEISVEDFKNLVQQALNLQPQQTYIVDDMAKILSEFSLKSDFVQFFTREMVDEFFTLCHYWPLQIKKNSNQSSGMHHTIQGFRPVLNQAFKERIEEIETLSLKAIVELLGTKIQQRFHKTQDAYMYYAQYGTFPDPLHPNHLENNELHTISLDDFIKASDQLRVRMSQKQAQEIFNALDLDHDGRLGYQEFCILAVEEQRQSAFHLNLRAKGPVTPVKENLKIDTDSLDHSNLMMNSHHHSAFKNREGKRENHYQSPECRGLKPLRSEYIGDLISTQASSFYTPKKTPTMIQLQSTPLSVRKQMDQTMGFQTNFKFFNRFHTRASELLMVAKHRVSPPSSKTKSTINSDSINSISQRGMFTNNMKAPPQRLKQLLEVEGLIHA